MKHLRGVVDNYRENLSLSLDLNPAFIILAGLFNGIIPFYLFTYDGVVYAPVFSLFSVLIVFLFLKLFSVPSCYKQFAKFAIFTLLGVFVYYNAYTPSKLNYVSLIPKRNCSAEIKVLICDTTDTSPDLEWMPRKKMIMAEVLELRISQSLEWRKSSGRIVIELPDKIKSPGFGENVIIQGAFIEPEKPVVDGDFDYQKYLLSMGVRKVFYANTITPEENKKSFFTIMMAKVLHGRNSILDSMSVGMGLENRRMMAALIFGCRQGLFYESRRNFLKSGVIHIFAVSGLHVGMLALSLYLLLRWVPFRIRYLSVPFILLVYVITTGVQPSAMRALLMISIWSLMKALLYRTSPLNIVFISASIMLIVDPLSVLGAGFQFSFTIAFFLVVSWKSVKEWSFFMKEKQMWIPSDLITKRMLFISKIKSGLFNSFTTSLTAWLSGSALLFLYRSFFIPGAVFTNFIIIPFVWLLFVVSLLNLILIPFHFLFSLNSILDILFDTIRYISFAGSELGGGINIVTPGILLLILFFILLFFFTISKKRISFLISNLSIFLLISYCCFNRRIQDSNVFMFKGGESQEPAFVNIPRGYENGVVLINPGPKKRVKSILALLRKNGINSIDCMVFTENRKSCCEYAWIIFSNIEVKHVLFTPEYRRSRYAKSAYKKAFQSGSEITVIPKEELKDLECRYRNGLISFKKKKGEGYFIVINNLDEGVVVEQKTFSGGEKGIRLGDRGTLKQFSVINSSRLALEMIK